MRWTPAELSAQCGGRLLRAGTRAIAGAFIDSRAPLPGGLFVPIVARRDGHAFMPDAVAAGAAAVLLGPGRAAPAGDVTVVAVEDTLAALGVLGRAARARVSGPVVAVTGSNGKTTTRTFVQAILASALTPVLATRGNLNNHLGVPLCLLGEPHDARAAVLELGMSAPGEVDALAAIVRPDAAVITSIGLEHLESMGTLEAIARAEFEVAAHLVDGGALVIPADEPRLAALVDATLRARCRILGFGPGPTADVRVERVEVDAATTADLSVAGRRCRVRLRPFGAHNALNAAAALCVAVHLGLDLDAALAGLETVDPVGDRGRTVSWGEHLIVADCYNANPGSVDAALHSFARLREHRSGPLLAVLGDMLELGEAGPQLHAQVGALAAALGLDGVFGFGPLSRSTVDAAREGGVAAEHGHDVAAVAGWIRERLAPGSAGAVLVKGSRGMRLERVIEQLTSAPR